MEIENTLIIDGGLGRTITAIPALEKFVKKYPKTVILNYGWTPILFGNPILTNHVFDQGTKNMFQRIKDSKITKPEPYYNSDYLNGKINLADAFNQDINRDREKMPIPKIYLSETEIRNGKVVKRGSSPTIAFQPFGSTANITQEGVEDNTLRSLNRETTEAIVKYLRNEGFNIYLITDKMIPWLSKNDFIDYQAPFVRELSAAISHCDYFIGVDSSGQHIARSYNIPGTVIIGGTNPVNISYPDYFNLYNDDHTRQYMPYRIAEFDFYLSEIQNANILNFDSKKIKDCLAHIKKHLRKHIR